MYTDLLYSQLLFRGLLKPPVTKPVTKQFFIASDQSSVKFMILVSGKLSWDSLFPQLRQNKPQAVSGGRFPQDG